ncbi:NAD(P)/FAD-dependent oxidoreductase [Mucilaginibacter jinjuensis]|uniref:NAD(P)/FAD-dependent oxidoreductase n=1 Tax=Mucilaginibacter jinjuensis TaxID=1176721 RepID=A0ABY7T1M4_9SPHI|nr:NAD(P)/FAD-dependent oxidoreductase [Mucilaginibacter jinjuensis]WCT10322.1 NAD(P)/FAD-dependent oxidoreductase [Mucilaginibacter jinjuensis]
MDVDIAIIGGGVAGCTAAIALAKFYSVVLIDKLEEPPIRIGECLAPATRRILKQLDLLEGLERADKTIKEGLHLKNIGTRSYWGSEDVHIVDHLRNPDGFGWHLDRHAFEIYLRETALQRGVNCLWPARLRNVDYKDDHWNLSAVMADGIDRQQIYNYTAKFVIDASGRQSHFARKMDIDRQHFDKLVAYWATIPNLEQNQMSTISAGELGWWYSAPLPHAKRVIAFQTDSDLLKGGSIRTVDEFIELAQSDREMAMILEKVGRQIEIHKTASANSTRLTKVAGKQWAALGDAAISFDPLSSQGMFNAMASSVQLTELITTLDLLNNMEPATMHEFESRYTKQIDQIWMHYLNHKSIFYRQERRWKDAPFWRRRQDLMQQASE